MKAKLQGRIKAMGPSLKDSASMVAISVDLAGAVDESKSPEAKKIESEFVFYVKNVVAQQLKYGQNVVVTMSTEEAEI